MLRRRWLTPLAGSAILALSMVSPGLAGELCKMPEESTLLAATATAPTWRAVLSSCNAWVTTDYYSNASHTTIVGQCHITCAQYDQEIVFPTFGGGGTCQGTNTAFSSRLTSPCPCPP